MNTEIITRQEALRQGLTFYFTGKVCKHGHVSQRYAVGASCVTCCLQRSTQWQHDNPETSRQHWTNWRERNLDQARQATLNWYYQNPEVASSNRQRWNKANPERHRQYASKRRAAKLDRTPPWADLEAIKQFYIDCPKDMQVDHVVPLQGKLISGLHVLANLQYLTPAENMSKGNRWEPS